MCSLLRIADDQGLRLCFYSLSIFIINGIYNLWNRFAFNFD